MAKKQKNIAIYHNIQNKADLLSSHEQDFFSGGISSDLDFMPENILVWKSHKTLRVTGSYIHQRMILKLVLSGRCTMLVDGVRITLNAGDMLCLFPYQFHSTILECARNEYSFLAVTFTEKNKNYDSFSMLKYHVLHPDQKDLACLEKILDCRLGKEDIPAEEGVLSLLQILLHQRREVMGLPGMGVGERKQGKKEDFFDNVCKYVRGHFTDPGLNLNTLADHFGVSTESIRRSFKSSGCGYSPGKLIEQLRMQLALELLEHSRENVETIALRCGYSDGFTFSRAFRRVMGSAPGKIRKNKK